MHSRNLLQEMKEAVTDGLRKFASSEKVVTFSDLFSSDFISNILLTLQGDVIYIPTTPATPRSSSRLPTEPVVLMNFNPNEISKSHIAALGLVCNSIVTTERGYNGLAEPYLYHPIGFHPPPIGSWSIVSSLSSRASTSVFSNAPIVTSLSTQLSQWLQATQNFRLGHHSYLGLFQNRYIFLRSFFLNR